MTDLIHQLEFRAKVDELLKMCKANKNAVSISVCDSKGVECYVAMDAGGEDVAFMAAEQMFDYCKQISDDSGLEMAELANLLYKEVTNYFNLMLQEDNKQLKLLMNPTGEA